MNLAPLPISAEGFRALSASPSIGGADSPLNTKSEIPEIARALAECAGPIDAQRLERGIRAGCVYADAIVLSDDIIDYCAGGSSWARQVPYVGARFLEAAMLWSEVLPPTNIFWAGLRRYHQEYLETMVVEREISTGERSWESCDEALCLQIVRGKNGPVRALASLVVGLTNTDSLLDDFETLTLGYFAANQMLDDMKDWREDVRDGNISVLLRRTCAARPSVDDLRSIGIRMYAEGHVAYVLDYAHAHLAELAELAQRLGAKRYCALLNKRRMQFASLADQLRNDLAAQLARTGRNASA